MIDKTVFLELAYNQPRDAVIALYDAMESLERRVAAVEAEQAATQATVLELATVVHAPA